MTVAEICVTAYLIVAIPAAALTWSALIASTRHENKVKNTNPAYFVKYRPFREQNTKPGRLHT